MTIDFNCQKCEGSFELEANDLIDGSEKLECPHCGQKATASVVDDFVSALSEVRTQIAAMSKKFTVSLSIESEELEDEEEDEKEEDEDEEESDDDELDFDEDEDDVDEDEEDTED